MKTHRIIPFIVLIVLLSLSSSTVRAEQAVEIPEPSNQPLAKPAGIDLDVTYIGRAPMYNFYSVLYTSDMRPYLQPGTENDKRWPAPGEVVTFTAHIMNKGTTASGTFGFKWYVDGVQVAAGTHASLTPSEEGTESYAWTWAHQLAGDCLVGSHTIQFAADPANQISETYESNNNLLDRTDALSLVMTLSPSAYAAYEVPAGAQWPFSAEDWLQKQIAAMNAAFERSVYDSTPDGILERVRIDKILIADSQPPKDTHEDGNWFIGNDVRQTGGYYDPATDVDGGLIHELTHQLGIIDMYNLDVAMEIPQVLDLLGQPVQIGYYSGPFFPGLMNNPGIRPPVYDEHTALALNANKGCRRGYYGEYLYDVPDQVFLRVLDGQEQPAAGVTVKLYQRSSDPGLYGSFFGTVDDTPEISGVTDENGKVLLPNRSVGSPVTTKTGHTLHDNPLGVINIVGNDDQFILELTQGSHQEFHWLDVTTFNLAMWRGQKDVATLDIASHVPSPNAPASPGNLTGFQESGLVKLRWSVSPSYNITGYNVYRTHYPDYSYERIVTGTTSLSYVDPYNSQYPSATYVVSAVNSNGKESGFSNPFYAFRLTNPAGLVIDEQNNRIVLDPQNGYALYYQLENGKLFDTRGSVDYHLEYSNYIARDSVGHLILSHPADYYSSRHSVRVADSNASPLFEFGSQGSGPGQFETPTGVAAWGIACGIEGPYAVDDHTLLLLHFNNSYDGEQGEFATLRQVTFTEGKYGQGITIDEQDALAYETAGNLNRTQGAIEFWLRPHWDGNDNQSYVLFEVGNSWFNRMRIMKDGANNLRFMVWDSTTEYGVAYNVGNWQAEEWHHIAATWQGSTLTLAVDGEERARTSTAHLPDGLASGFYVGSTSGWDLQANADFDEFRISDLPRIGNSDACTYRILVADSGNNRIQAFDRFGNFVSAYGSLGSATGQFKNPQGLAVLQNGNVVVADSGNHRLQVLSFNGTSFDFVRTITASLNGPTGIATYGQHEILAADTGNNKIKVLTDQGVLVSTYESPNDGHVGTFSQPRGVVVDQKANIIVADTGNQRIVSIPGAFAVNVTAVTRTDPSPSGSAVVRFTVKFSKPVSGVNTSAPFDDLSLATSGVTGATITAVTGSGDTYFVTVNTGSGNGRIRLNVVDDNTITDVAGNPLGGANVGDGDFANGETYTILRDQTFLDVPVSYWAWQYIERLYLAGITGGCTTSPLNYCPGAPVTRDQMAVFLLRGIHGSAYSPPPLNGSSSFADVPSDHWAAAWIKELAAEGITSGCGGNNFCPGMAVTREQMAVFLLRAKHASTYTPPAATGVFADVSAGSWAAAWIEELAAEGITSGCGGGNYCPGVTVTRDQMAVFLVRTFALP